MVLEKADSTIHRRQSHDSAVLPPPVSEPEISFDLPEGAGAPNYTVTPKSVSNGSLDGDVLEVSMGPQHPSTHGVFRMDVVLDGETVIKLQAGFWYLHRNHEQIARRLPTWDRCLY